MSEGQWRGPIERQAAFDEERKIQSAAALRKWRPLPEDLDPREPRGVDASLRVSIRRTNRMLHQIDMLTSIGILAVIWLGALALLAAVIDLASIAWERFS